MRYLLSLTLLLAMLSLASAFHVPGGLLHKKLQAGVLDSLLKEKLPEKYGPFYFDQPIDHFLPNSSTFKHRYWANTDHYKPGGPVILYNAGETPADKRSLYVINSTMAELAKNLDGIVIVMEHRFYGKSMPAPDFSAKSLKTLNTEQALRDMVSFILDLKLPNLDHELPLAPETRYIVYGGSYSGNLAAWMRLKYPDIVFAAVPSSAPVQMSYDYYQYFEPIRKYGPAHCIQALEASVAYIDHILFNPIGDKEGLKKKFGLEGLYHDDDFAEILSYPLGLWQSMSPTSNPFEEKFCSIFDGLNSIHDYVGAYANYTSQLVQKFCGHRSVNACFDTHDPKSASYTDESSSDRAWLWQVCTEYAYWQTAAPAWRPTLVSRKLDTDWYQRQCPLSFGEHEVPHRPLWREFNKEYQGWYLSLDRVYWIDGEWDPWRTLSVQSDDAPHRHGWKENAKYSVLPKSVHHWDFFVTDKVSEAIKSTQEDVLNTLKVWIQEDELKRQASKQAHIKYQYQAPISLE